MGLFSDGPPSTVDDLTAQDSFLTGVAGTEGVDVSIKTALAYDELEIELTEIFGREASIYAPVLGQAPLDTMHLAVTPALKLWHTFKSLELVYRDCYFNQLNDRYKEKWAEYQRQANLSRVRFINTGACLVIDPLPIPSSAQTSFQAAPQGGGTIYIGVTLINAENEESSVSSILECVVPDQQQLVIALPAAPINAVGWNLYAGYGPNAITLQNTASLAIGTYCDFVFPPTTIGRGPGAGQQGNVMRDLPRRIMRG